MAPQVCGFCVCVCLGCAPPLWLSVCCSILNGAGGTRGACMRVFRFRAPLFPKVYQRSQPRPDALLRVLLKPSAYLKLLYALLVWVSCFSQGTRSPRELSGCQQAKHVKGEGPLLSAALCPVTHNRRNHCICGTGLYTIAVLMHSCKVTHTHTHTHTHTRTRMHARTGRNDACQDA